MIGVLRRLYQPKYLVKKELQLGEMPSTKEGYKTAFSTAFAAIVETFLISLIGMADTLMVSKMGPTAIAAVGIGVQPRYLIQALVISLNVAVASICARRYGEGDRNGAVNSLKQGLLLSTGISIVFLFISLPLTNPLLHMMGAQPEIMQMAHDYLYIIFLGLPICGISLTISSALRGIGKTRASMAINIIANVVNIVFNYLLINGIGPFPELGVKGAAIATVIGWAVGLVVALILVLQPSSFLFVGERDGWDFDKRTIRGMFEVTSGSFVEQVCIRGGFMLYAKIVAGLGVTMFAAHQIYMNILSLSFSFGEGFGIAASSLVGQNLGAKRPDLSIVYGNICQRMSIISSTALFLVFTFGGKFLAGMFTTDPAILGLAGPIFFIMTLILIGQSSQMVYMGALRGAGDTKYTAVVSLICILLLRPGAGYLLSYPLNMGLIGAWIAVFLDQVVRVILTYKRFSSGKWTTIEL